LGDAEIQEASAVAQSVAGFSSYLYGIGYSLEQWQQELDAAVAHIKSQSRKG
jgi:hypothetical protein